MESAQAPLIPLKTNYVVYTHVAKMFEDKTGWFVQFDGSWESLYFSVEKPHFVVGEAIRISFEKVSHAKP